MGPDPLKVLLRAAAGFAAGIAAAVVVLAAITLSSTTEPIDRAIVESALARGLLYGTPLAMLPAMWHARAGAVKATAWAGLLAGTLGVLLTITVAGWIAPVAMRPYSLEEMERARGAVQRDRDHFDLSAPRRVPERRNRTTPLRPLSPTDAVAADPAMKTWADLIRSEREQSPRQTTYVTESERRIYFAGLAAVLAFFGWTLGSVRGDHALYVVMWWAMVGMLMLLSGGSRIGTAVVVFGLAALLLKISAGQVPGAHERA